MNEDNKQYNWYNEITSTQVDWLWFPFFACGKISVVQGDPGSGKSLFMTDCIARLTTGRSFSDEKKHDPINVIYQCSEDGLEDTIRPRLEKAGADCSRVAYINEDLCSVTLDDEIIRKTIINVDAKMLIIDPIQAYLGDSDLSNASRMRKVMKTLGTWAAAFNCAVVLVGHLNKRSGVNELYRGLGSVDIMALARSVIQIEKSYEEPNIRYVRQLKNSLSSIGPVLSFTIDKNGHLRWITDSQSDYYSQQIVDPPAELANWKCETASLIISKLLAAGPLPAAIVLNEVMKANIAERTIKRAKKMIGIVSFRKNGQWYWKMPEADSDWQL